MFDLYADIVLRLPLRQTFTYLIPPELSETAAVGMRVKVSFRNRQEEGVIMAIHRQTPEYEVLPLLALIDPAPLLTPDQLELAGWMSDYYLAGMGECVYKMFPQGRRYPKKVKEQRRETPVPEHDLNDEQAAVYNQVSALLAKIPTPDKTSSASVASVSAVVGGTAAEKISEKGRGVHLVHGVTGSGKTEIYIHLIMACLERNLGAILLVPEISLTVQLIERLEFVFKDRLALLHSALKKSQRFGGYVALLRGEKTVAVGTRSAIFAPVPDLSLIIMDEEHDSSYKEHSAPRYHARQIAYRRLEKTGGVLLLSSATPAVETTYNARRGQEGFAYHRLIKRATGAQLPEVTPIQVESPDIPISGRLVNELDENRRAGRQSILLLNRRGYYPYLYCTSCEESQSCPNCSVTLNLHRDGSLICHYCSYKRFDQGRCINCGAATVRLGSGTQKLEEYLFNLFPDVKLERLDTDTAARKDVVQESIGRLLRGELDILMGTQMIAKGLDAPNVTLVGVLQADQGLNMPDFRAAERTFSLLTQVAGRAGRGDLQGRVFFEVMNPENQIINFARHQDYDGFYAEEINNRREAMYPPFCRIIRLLFRSENEKNARNAAQGLADILVSEFKDITDGKPIVLGPAPAPIARLHNQFRFHIVLKTLRPNFLRRIIDKNLVRIHKLKKNDTYLEIDFDPVDMF